MKFKVGYTEQSKGWTASIAVEGDNEQEVKDKAKQLSLECQKHSQLMTLQKIRG